MPVTVTRSPGTTASHMFSNRYSDTEWGASPSGTDSGASCILIFCLSR